MRKIVYTEHQIQEIAQQLLSSVSTKVLCFYGDMGAGKTTLIKALVENLGGSEAANSPTFGIVNEYHKTTGELLAFHFDFYRLNEETEALDLGLEDYLSSNVWIFIEWPEKILSLLPEETTDLYISILDASSRRIAY